MWIANEIAGLRWEHGSVNALAAKWGLSRESVSIMVSSARDHLLESLGNPEHLYAELSQGLRKVFVDSVREGDRRHAIDAGRELAKLAGAGAANTVDVRLKELSDVELHARYKAALARASREYAEPSEGSGGD